MGKFPKALLAMLLVFLLALVAACSSDDATTEPDADGETEDVETEDGEAAGSEDGLYSIDDFTNVKMADGEEILDGGSITFGLVLDSPFEGILNWNFYQSNPDAQVLQWFDDALIDWDENYVMTQDGAATYEISEDGRTFTFTIRDNVNWHDGEPVTAEDWAFAHEVIGHPNYDGIRFDDTLRNVEGIEEYHNGEADHISGIEVVDEKTLKITYKKATPSLMTGGVWYYPLAKHIFGDMDIEDISSSPEVRQNPIGFGPFKVENVVPGESVVYSKNEDYWRGEPNLDEVVLKVVSPNVVMQSLRSGEIDLVHSFPADQFPDNADTSNLDWLGVVDRAYTYIGFKLGTWEDGEVKTDPDAKMADVNLRRAMWHAIDNDAVGERFYHGLRWAGTTLIPPSHPEFHDDTNPGRAYDPELAKQLLDEAGYEDVDGDGFREDLEGNELVINFASMSGGDIAEPLAQYYIQAWEQVGLKVQLLDGRLHEFNAFYDRVEEDDPDIDIYQGAWGVGIDVDPSGLYGRRAPFNYTRWSSEENDRLLEEALSEEAFDVEKRQEIYKEWQQLMVDEVPVIPTLYRSEIVPVNKRIVNWAIGDGHGVYRHELGITQEEPVVAE
ncbi:oligopeptide ABC transporter substrate-binding protein [Halalkalibacterium halodurans]|uniref:oligopeptide ABC transporter substrate-binding protein n=1 Tax=Halalkalibacterium halodurans TaxID=86665 RepID=UPI00106878DE|nr:oligopeptide ABC transporter substrate-binding protein [Halalkalibacterium halodurans]TES51670.1 oligopeptide ABC transporter substrate-binding protein [Halalkalibacterium halodurans]